MKETIGWNLEDLEAATCLVDATPSDSDDESPVWPYVEYIIPVPQVVARYPALSTYFIM
jgi:hypothetical protein